MGQVLPFTDYQWLLLPTHTPGRGNWVATALLCFTRPAGDTSESFLALREDVFPKDPCRCPCYGVRLDVRKPPKAVPIGFTLMVVTARSGRVYSLAADAANHEGVIRNMERGDATVEVVGTISAPAPPAPAAAHVRVRGFARDALDRALAQPQLEPPSAASEAMGQVILALLGLLETLDHLDAGAGAAAGAGAGAGEAAAAAAGVDAGVDEGTGAKRTRGA
jgi:hypothetical protein